MSSHDEPLTSVESVDDGNAQATVGKGKARTMPVPIRPSSVLHDLFDMSPSAVTSYRTGESSSGSLAFSPATSNFSSPDFDNRYRNHNLSIESMEQLESPGSESFLSDTTSAKGKGRESFPYLPPLSFSVIRLDYEGDLSPTPGPSSYGALYSPTPVTANLPSSREISIASPSSSPEPDSPDAARSHLLRCQSLSNLSRPISPLLSTALTTPPVFGPSRTPSNISRQLILDQNANSNESPPLDPTAHTTALSSVISSSTLSVIEREPSSYPPAWYTVSKPKSPIVTTQPGTIHLPTPRSSLKPKVRSKSSPYPISVLDFIPATSSDLFEPIPIVIPNYFDLILPKELRLHILRSLIDVHEQDYLRSVREGRLTAAKATSSRGRWVGRDKGVRELFKLSRVSKGWRSLVFDGELWIDVDLRSFHSLPPAIVVRLVQAAGTFVQSLNVAGHVQLHADAMTDITTSLCLTVPQTPLSYTQITKANFQGCVSLTTRSLHHFLVRSRSLQTLSVKGLSAVTNTTCDILANFCPSLVSLNMSRCPNLDGHGIEALTLSALFRKEHLLLKELRVSGLKYVSDSVMQALGRAAPYLEVLDLSYSRQLHNSALDAFVACEGYTDNLLALETVLVSPRDLGRDVNDSTKLKRRVTRLRHLILSSCLLLTDTACANLAHSVPKLEFLELAGIGGSMKDTGLICLLSTTPHIRRLDLEDALDITDKVLATITPAPIPVEDASAATTPLKKKTPPPKQPGYALQQLNVSYATQLTDDAFLNLIHNCPRLAVLEADNTRMSAAVLREFVRVARERTTRHARIVAIDCRGIHEGLVKELAPMTRPRVGWRAYGARKLGFLDARDDNDDEMRAGHGQDEMDEERVVLKSFYSWQTVDAVKAAREKRRRATAARRTASESSTGSAGGVAGDFERVFGGGGSGRARWWSPGGRRSPRAGGGNAGGEQDRNSPPILPDLNGEGCRTM
ncbi:hypothetical protein JR316_0000391 [Psilocybe cubensis]|uniref:F-box domain-containing protein n=2 Tax=Psilocybe cubensis TaxID=181762 RepID=A0A8H7Y9V3_PSICU|nr:hypothetical protein JR316_0000391 [Psilocybe cubensis]KAH9486327.1 hypothetical protein JR316_0000391 [Psilocybe cubensis]